MIKAPNLVQRRSRECLSILEGEPLCSGSVRAFFRAFSTPLFFKNQVISSLIFFSPNMSTKLLIVDVSSLLKKIKGGFMTNYYSKCPELDKNVHNVIKHQIWNKATQWYTNAYQEGNYRVAVV